MSLTATTTVALYANTDWYLFNFRRSLATSLKERGYRVLLISPPGKYGERLIEEGFDWIPAPMDRSSLNPVRELMLVIWLARLFKKREVSIVHGFTIKCVVYGVAAARIVGIQRVVCSVAGMGYIFSSHSIKARVLRFPVSQLLRASLRGRLVRLILQNPDDVEMFSRGRLISPASIRLIRGSGVDCVRFGMKSHDYSDVPFRVLLPARLLWDKGVAEFIEAARLLKARDYPIEFLLAGTPDLGNPAAVSEAKIECWVKDGLVEWLGHVEDMPSLFHSVAVVALPSYREGLPKGLIEASACGCSIVTTDVPGCREVVTHEVTGLLVKVRDATDLAGAIVRLYENPLLLVKLGRAARRRAVRDFDERTVNSQTVAVYEHLMGPSNLASESAAITGEHGDN